MLMFTVLIKAGSRGEERKFPTGMLWEKHSPAPTKHPEVRRFLGVFLILKVGARQPRISPECVQGRHVPLAASPYARLQRDPCLLGGLDPGLAPWGVKAAPLSLPWAAVSF